MAINDLVTAGRRRLFACNRERYHDIELATVMSLRADGDIEPVVRQK